MGRTIAVDNCGICGGKRELKSISTSHGKPVLVGMCHTCDHRRCGWDAKQRQHVGWTQHTEHTCALVITDPLAKTCPNGHHI